MPAAREAPPPNAGAMSVWPRARSAREARESAGGAMTRRLSAVFARGAVLSPWYAGALHDMETRLSSGPDRESTALREIRKEPSMRLWILAPLFALPMIIAAVGCGDDETTTAAASSSASASSGGGATVNGCDAATAMDMTTQTAVTIAFPSTAYNPKCVRVKTGTTVTWQGDFTIHPLVGGEFKDGT